ncbi:DNA primase small subunit [Intoshia linei]|uniref:DNA primase n=1 Tax=Intoshia linei TaxID=1819745 RepID=A0A177B7Y5_9BILA|nr:DNA primase small subunit [Intoshia linei]
MDENLKLYYTKLFPAETLYQWFSYGNTDLFSKREFAYERNSFFNRNVGFENLLQFKNWLSKEIPMRIDIGGVSNIKIVDHKIMGNHEYVEKEMVLDIDMTDYDSVRHCCSEAKICDKCWPLIHMVIKIIDETLRDDFGFKLILWVYSGRRGVHCWICDKEARYLSQESRAAIVNYLTILNNDHIIDLTSSYKHPFLKRALKICSKYVESYLIQDQDFLGSETKMNHVFKKLNADVKSYLIQSLNQHKSSKERWDQLKVEIKNCAKKKLNIENLDDEIILQYCSPRLDVNVSKQLNHLLKCPFSVHPKTGRICVAIDSNNVEKFDPFNVPTIDQLIKEVNETSITNMQQFSHSKQTMLQMASSLGPTVLYFQKFIKQIEFENKRKQYQIDKSFVN